MSLDELFRESAEEPAWRTRRPAVRVIVRWLRATLVAAALAAALVLVLRALRYDLWFPIPLAGMFALLVLRRIVLGLRVRPVGPLAELPARPAEPSEPDQVAAAVTRWQTRLSWGRAGMRPFTRTSPMVAELVDERLRLRHGLTRASDPTRARTLMGERLWSYLADPDARTPPPRQLAALLTEVERL